MMPGPIRRLVERSLKECTSSKYSGTDAGMNIRNFLRVSDHILVCQKFVLLLLLPCPQ